MLKLRAVCHCYMLNNSEDGFTFIQHFHSRYFHAILVLLLRWISAFKKKGQICFLNILDFKPLHHLIKKIVYILNVISFTTSQD